MWGIYIYIYIQFYFPSGGNSNVTFFVVAMIHFLLRDDDVDVSHLWSYFVCFFIVDNL